MIQLSATCPICEAQVNLLQDAELSEIISCSDCSTRLVIAALTKTSATLEEAPAIEEDWGE